MSRLALVAGVVLALAPAPVGADCANGLSEGHDQCQKYSSCLCRSETVKDCPAGRWYTRYFVVEPCPEMKPTTPPRVAPPSLRRKPRIFHPVDPSGPAPPPPPPRGAPPRPPTSPREKHCHLMRNWLKAERRTLASYRDDALLAEAISRGLSPNAYTNLLWERLPGSAGSGESAGGDHAVMRTDPHTCKVRAWTIKPGCDWLLAQGLPRASCAIALHHEQTHVRQCQAGIPDLTDLRNYRDREVEAYEQMIREIEGWIRRNCRGS